jgi:L-lysine 2,3-aminomutase
MPRSISELTAKRPWQEALSDLITDPRELWALLELDPRQLPEAVAAAQLFPLKVTRSFVARMQKGNLNDPLLKQILPLGIELLPVSDYNSDPLQEMNANPIPGLLHKYYGRVLITLTSACAVHCRYCFRRDFPYQENNPGRLGWEKIFAYIGQNDTISEVILSGGDPLAVSDKLLKLFNDQLALIPHVKRLRIHTRLPIVLPERITPSLLEWITRSTLDVIVVVHANHPNEMTPDVKASLLALRHAGISVLNQSVLLKGVNDDAQTLISLSEVLFKAGVLPYYLHVLDKVPGAAHFDLPRSRARELHTALRHHLPGYLVPRLACEEPGELSKTLL